MSSPSGNELSLIQAALKDAQAAVPAVVVGSLLLGVFTLLMGFSRYIHRYKALHTRIHAIMLTVTVLMYATATTYWAITVHSLIQIINIPDRFALSSSQSAGTTSRILTVCVGLNYGLSDITLIWRTWVLWSDRPRLRRIVGGLPCVLFAGAVVGALISITADPREGLESMSDPNAGPGEYYNEPTATYASYAGEVATVLSIALNVWCVVFGIVKFQQFRNLQRLAGRHLYDTRSGMVLILLALFGVLYCIFWIYWGIVSVSNVGPKLNTTWLLCNNAAAVQLNGLYPTFVIVSASLQQTYTAQAGHTPLSSPSHAAREHSRFASNTPTIRISLRDTTYSST